MSENAHYALAVAVIQRLMQTAEGWTGVYQDAAPETVPRPYVTIAFAGGGERNRRVGRSDPELLLNVLAVADDSATASTLDARIATLLDDADRDSPLELYAGADWLVLTMTREMALHKIERADGVRKTYHTGARYRARMEAT
jgi:hypothetical protein